MKYSNKTILLLVAFIVSTAAFATNEEPDDTIKTVLEKITKSYYILS